MGENRRTKDLPMKKTFLTLFFLLFSVYAKAEVIHGIDVNKVYTSSDWRSINDIYDIILDYEKLTKYKKNLMQCSQMSEKQNECYDKLAEKIITGFYSYQAEDNLKAYQNYLKAAYDAYGFQYCRNKYAVPPGTICVQEYQSKTRKIINDYLSSLLKQTEQHIKSFDFIEDYRD